MHNGQSLLQKEMHLGVKDLDWGSSLPWVLGLEKWPLPRLQNGNDGLLAQETLG